MTAKELKSLQEEPKELSRPLRALWHDAQGNWELAHGIVQDDFSPEAAWVHAYLHRKEGDHGNAAYWYARAQKPPAPGSLEAEWEQIAARLLPASEGSSR